MKRRKRKGFFRRFLFMGGLTLSGLYLVLHLIVASEPVQRRVFAEIQKALAGSGLDLKIESIQFAAFAPKIYLNRVTLRTLPSAPVVFPAPLNIDKIKIEFQPLALISGRVVIEDATLYHPIILLPSADQLYRKIDQLLKSRKRVELQGGFFKVVVKKFGVVDAQIDISSQNPSFSVRSRSLSVALENNLGGQQNITASSSHLEIKRGSLNLALSALDLNLSTSTKSLRVNRALIEGGDLYINLKGSASYPQGKEKLPANINASYDLRVPIALLNDIPELDPPTLGGMVKSAGNVRLANNSFAGSGTVDYDRLSVKGVKINSGHLGYQLSERRLTVTDLRAHYAGGLGTSKEIRIELKDRYPIQGNIQVSDIRLETLLDNLKQPEVPLRLGISGPVAVSGHLAGPFELFGDIDVKTSEFDVWGPSKRKPASLADRMHILKIPEGKVQGRLSFNQERFGFNAKLNMLGGTFTGDGSITYDDVYVKIKAKGENVSLNQLKRIAEVQLAGTAKVSADIEVVNKSPKVNGTVEAMDGEVGEIVLGAVKGQILYQDDLLAFENMEAASSLEPVLGSGFVDFGPEKTHYKFTVEGKRLEVDQAFRALSKKGLAFRPPKGGEVAARLLIEGGHDDEGIEVVTSGQAKNFRWYEEDWFSSTFAVTFRLKNTELSRVLLMKKNGGVEFKGNIGEAGSRVHIVSHGLRLEELQWVDRAPLRGQVVGELTLKGDLKHPEGSGEIRLVNAAFRSKSLPDSVVRVRTENARMEILGRFFGEKLRGRLTKPIRAKNGGRENWDFLFYFEKFDFIPLLAAWLGQDMPTVTEVQATGEVALSGDVTDWKSFRGTGTMSELELGLRGTPMRNKGPIKLKVEQGDILLDHVVLSGKDSQLSLDLKLIPHETISADIDGKLDLEYLQPFIPGMEYGSGRVSVGLRFSGAPEKFQLLGNVALQDGAFRITGLQDDFRNAQLQLSVSQDRLNIDRFSATVNGGLIEATGDVRIDRFTKFAPNLRFTANRVTMKTGDYLTTRLSGDFNLAGETKPYLLSGKCRVIEANLTKFATGDKSREEPPRIIKFDIQCDARQKLYVRTDVMNAEFRGNLHIVGDNSQIGLLGSTESIQGVLFFRERKFNLSSANVKFESPTSIQPRFNVAGRALVREGKSTSTGKISSSQEYEVNLLVYGTPDNYKLRLTSSPELAEAEIISLLLLGVTSRTQPDGSAVDLGTTIVGQIPLQSKLENQLGLDIRFQTQTSNAQNQNPTTPSQTQSTTAQSSSSNTDVTVPSVQIQKEITERTRVSYSNTLENVPVREFKIEHMLDDNLTVNGVAVDRSRTGTETQSSQSYGLDVRYRFQFE